MNDCAPVQGDPRRSIPRTDALLAAAEFVAAARLLGDQTVKSVINDAQAQARRAAISPDQVRASALCALAARTRNSTSLRRVFNATGVVLHTNIGRAPLSGAARDAMTLAAGYCDVEFDLATGRRARRGRGTLAALRDLLPDGTEALVVNNGAAALALVASTLAVGSGRPEIVLSRGEMVEIGDGFRIPELIESTGARIREVGTTNRAHVADYERAIGQDTGFVLKVHPSNFRVEGFTSAVEVPALVGVCRPAAIPLVVDIGSGLLRADDLLPDEPDATTTLRAGADLVTASGDKLLGGPQAGLILGKPLLVDRVRRHPLARAMRVDKTTLAALEATLLGEVTPTYRALHADSHQMRFRAQQLADAVGGRVVPSQGAVGGGGAPGLPLPGWAVALPQEYADALRQGDPAVIGRTEAGVCLLDVRCLAPEDVPIVSAAVVAVAALTAPGSATARRNNT
ncbi:MAG: L-seryl-tRNA(Sec) selenium transferase [Micrococcales bacterium]|nr:L-seryl-tRNA(Sec) selenium transferase [Micrococcales bacterium]